MTHSLASRSPLPLLLLLLLVPGVGAASYLPGMDARAPLRLMEDPAPVPVPERPSEVLRVLSEIGVGTLLGAGGIVVGYSSAYELCTAPGFECIGVGVIGAAVGASIGFSLGTFVGGEWLKGDGKLLGALGGMAVGLGVGVGVGFASQNAFTGALIGAPLSMLGSIVGYESTVVSLQPAVALSSRGATFGLRGAF